MYNVDLRKKWCVSPGKFYKRRAWFLLVSKNVNVLYRSVLTSNGSILYIAQTQHFCESQIPKDQNWSFRCDEFVFQKVYLFKHVFQLLPSIWSVLLECLHHFYVVIFYGVFLRCWFLGFLVCSFALFCCCFYSFQFCFYFWQNFSSNSKGTDVTTAVVELNIRTIIAPLLLALEIVHYLWELTVQ